jgi:hypothetical protein
MEVQCSALEHEDRVHISKEVIEGQES